MRKPATAILIVAGLVLFVVFLVPKVWQIRTLQKRSHNLEVELDKLQTQNRFLENELRLLREDPVYLEKVARQKFNKAKQGEIVYKVVREGQDEEESKD